MPANPKPSSKKKAPTCFVLLFSILIVVFCVSIVTTQKDKDAEETASNNTGEGVRLKETATPTIEKSVKAIMDGGSLTQSDAEVAFDVIKSVGFTRVDKLEFIRETNDFKAYSADLGYIDNFRIAFVGSEIVIIDNPHLTFYDKSQGGIVDMITNYTLTDSEKLSYEQTTKDNVKLGLKAPSTAEFPSPVWNADEWHVSRNKDTVTVQSYVDAQNSFGAMIRNEFLAQYSYSTGDPLYLEIDGNVVYGSLQ